MSHRTLLLLANQAFEALLTSEKVDAVPYQSRWSSSPGYLDRAVRSIVSSHIVRSVDPEGRRILVLPVAGLHNVIIVDREPGVTGDLAYFSVCDFDFCLEHFYKGSIVDLSLSLGGTDNGELTETVAALLVGMAATQGYKFEAGSVIDVMA